jgi:hypothetical protein
MTAGDDARPPVAYGIIEGPALYYPFRGGPLAALFGRRSDPKPGFSLEGLKPATPTGRPTVFPARRSSTIRGDIVLSRPKISDGPKPEVVTLVLKRNLPALRRCYDRELLKTPGIAGRIVLSWRVASSGKVGSARVAASHLGSSALHSCILGIIKGVAFPAPPDGRPYEVSYPLILRTSEL